MLPLFRLGLGGRLGSGRQWMSWITLVDAVSAILFALDTASLPASMGVKGAPASEAQPGIGVCVQPTTLLHSSEVQPSPSSQLPHEAHVAAPAPVA